jgi:hypothetical protein
MHSWIAVMLVVGCGGGAKVGPANVATPAVTIRPILVLIGSGLDENDMARILACAKVEQGTPATFLTGTACAPLLDGVDVEIVLESGRVPVKLGAKTTAMDCAAGENPEEVPVVKIVGLPKTEARSSYIVGKGMAEGVSPVAPAVLDLIYNTRPRYELKVQGHFGPSPVGQFDLDGDGVFEVIMSADEQQDHELFKSDGTSIAKVGCYLG